MHKTLLAFFLIIASLSAEQTKHYDTKPKVPYSVEEAEKVRSEAIQNLKLAQQNRDTLMTERDRQNIDVRTERSPEKKTVAQKGQFKPKSNEVAEAKTSKKSSTKKDILPPKKLQPLRANKCACAHSEVQTKKKTKHITYPKKLLYVK